MTSVVRHGPQGGVLWVDATAQGQTVTLAGYCRYWIEGEQMGGYACGDHPGIGGPVSYRWTGVRFVRETRLPTLDGDILVGEWLPDDVWREAVA